MELEHRFQNPGPSLMSIAPDAIAILQQLIALETEYWFDVDFNWGRNAHTSYVEDGVFVIGDSRMAGRAAIAQFYRWREQRGIRTARHVVTNFRLHAANGSQASLGCILLLYAADGAPVLPSLPAILIADVHSDFICGADERYLFQSHVLSPVFMGGEAPTVPPKQS
jgi:hypothetical protein